MTLPLTLSRYLATRYIINTLFLVVGLLSLVYLFDTVELVRRANKTSNVPFSLVLQMGLLKLPDVGQILFPFAILFSAMFTFWQLNQRSELVVLRASGFSVWQFLAPVILVALLTGMLQVGIINPVGALFIGKYQQLENTYLERQENQIALFREGLWLRQELDSPMGPQKQHAKSYVILHAKKVRQPEWILQKLTVFYFDSQDNLERRLDADEAVLKPDKWVFRTAKIHSTGGEISEHTTWELPTRLTIQDIEDSFSSPQSLSFWQLPAHIKTLEETGFNTSSLEVHYQSLLAQPLFLATMVLLAATVAMRPPRAGQHLILIGAGVFTGFFVFFLSSYLQALGASQQIPPLLAAWSPTVIFVLLGFTALINLEDG